MDLDQRWTSLIYGAVAQSLYLNVRILSATVSLSLIHYSSDALNSTEIGLLNQFGETVL